MTIYCDKCGARHDSSVCPSCSGFGKNPPMTADDVRARFEAGIRKTSPEWVLDKYPDGTYLHPEVQAQWRGYRAAHADRDAEVRELVEVCQDIEPWLAKHIVGGQLANRLRAALAKFTQEKP